MSRFKEALLFFTVLFIVYRPPYDPDFWWHLKYGEAIFTTHTIPVLDIFSSTMRGYEWHSSYWLAEAIMFALTKVGGLFLPTLVFSIILAAVLVVSSRRFSDSFPARFAAVVLASTGFALAFVANRPLFFSTIFFLFEWWIITSKRDKLLVVLPALFLIWANVHADFVVGLAILAFYCGVAVFFEKNRFRWVFTSLILSALVTFINPFGISLHKTLLNEIVNMPLQFSLINEWGPVPIQSFGVYMYLVFVISACLFALVERVKGRKFDGQTILTVSVLVLTSVISIKSVYFCRILAALALPTLYVFFKEFADSVSKIKLTTLAKVGLLVGLGSQFFILAAYFAAMLYISLDAKLTFQYGKYPYEAVSYAKAKNLKGNVFNTYGWGGFLIYVAPQYPTFIDGRMASWVLDEERFLSTYNKIARLEDPAFTMAQFDKYGVGWVLVPGKGEKLTNFLVKTQGWKVVYRDNLAIIAVRP